MMKKCLRTIIALSVLWVVPQLLANKDAMNVEPADKAPMPSVLRALIFDEPASEQPHHKRRRVEFGQVNDNEFREVAQTLLALGLAGKRPSGGDSCMMRRHPAIGLRTLPAPAPLAPASVPAAQEESADVACPPDGDQYRGGSSLAGYEFSSELGLLDAEDEGDDDIDQDDDDQDLEDDACADEQVNEESVEQPATDQEADACAQKDAVEQDAIASLDDEGSGGNPALDDEQQPTADEPPQGRLELAPCSAVSVALPRPRIHWIKFTLKSMRAEESCVVYARNIAKSFLGHVRVAELERYTSTGEIVCCLETFPKRMIDSFECYVLLDTKAERVQFLKKQSSEVLRAWRPIFNFFKRAYQSRFVRIIDQILKQRKKG